MSWIKLNKFCTDRGYTRGAVYQNLRRYWPQGIIWSKAPNGRIYINPDAHDAWVGGTLDAYMAEHSPRR